ncbi:hypothetical protein BDB00DRAFT_139384 [Zychaea mexicana]|uniref:uncharacterized protein n=1 Tax=Zychaea mexicana TaxID=64656 RepID=UPI0022FE1F04|nr:uncharacterized protein BDB00DRAFT_139384 [Zychaea mexicana]KAI9496258.1 hypothetical protein BDB00DRAFT_139384 [Zychaea mexicana]
MWYLEEACTTRYFLTEFPSFYAKVHYPSIREQKLDRIQQKLDRIQQNWTASRQKLDRIQQNWTVSTKIGPHPKLKDRIRTASSKNWTASSKNWTVSSKNWTVSSKIGPYPAKLDRIHKIEGPYPDRIQQKLDRIPQSNTCNSP